MTRETFGRGCNLLSHPGAYRTRKRARDPGSPYCQEVWNGVKHTLLVCSHFLGVRAELVRALVRPLVPEYISRILCGDPIVAVLSNELLRKNNWAGEAVLRRTFLDIVKEILTANEIDERTREADEKSRMTNCGKRRQPQQQPEVQGLQLVGGPADI